MNTGLLQQASLAGTLLSSETVLTRKRLPGKDPREKLEDGEVFVSKKGQQDQRMG